MQAGKEGFEGDMVVYIAGWQYAYNDANNSQVSTIKILAGGFDWKVENNMHV